MVGQFEGLHGCRPIAVVSGELVKHPKLLVGERVGSMQQDCHEDHWYPEVLPGSGLSWTSGSSPSLDTVLDPH